MTASSPEVLCFELPYAAATPCLTHRATAGIRRVVARSHESFDVHATIFDTADHRLLRNGLTLAHRSIDGIEQWYFSAPTWAPLLPTEVVRPGGVEMPSHFAGWATPVRRHAELGPVVEVSMQQRRYLARGENDIVVAALHESAATIRSGGVTTARYREVSVELSPEATSQQRTEIVAALEDRGATAVAGFPTLHQRIGAPATGLPDLPQRREWQREDSLGTFVGALLATRTRDLIEADFAIRSGLDDGTTHGVALMALADDLRGLDGMIDPVFSRPMIRDVEAHAAVAAPLDADSYISIVDRLVGATRTLPAGPQARRGAAAVVRKSLDEALQTLFAVAEKVEVDSSDQRWHAAADAAQHAAWRARIWAVLQGKKGHLLADRVATLAHSLVACTAVPSEPDLAGLVEHDAAAGFAAGRAFERAIILRDAERSRWVKKWPRRRRRLERAS